MRGKAGKVYSSIGHFCLGPTHSLITFLFVSGCYFLIICWVFQFLICNSILLAVFYSRLICNTLGFLAGTVHYVNDRGKTSHLLTAENSVQKLLFMEKKDVLVLITDALLLSLHKICPEGEAEELMKVGCMKASFKVGLVCGDFDKFGDGAEYK